MAFFFVKRILANQAFEQAEYSQTSLTLLARHVSATIFIVLVMILHYYWDVYCVCVIYFL